MAADYYAALGVSPDASAEDIKKAFRALARKYHPDATGGDAEGAERYKEISEAYSVLSDPDRRRDYDMSRSGLNIPGFAGSIFDDLVESFFGGGRTRVRQRTRARRGESVEISVELDFREAVFGTHRTARLQRFDPCERCSGSGCEPGSHPVRCGRCNGTGEIQQVRRSAFGQLVTSYPCTGCDQTGMAILTPCQMCRGTGRVPEDADVPLQIPPGIEDGDRLRLDGEGEAGTAGGPRGDLYVRFFVRPDDRFVRRGEDLLTWVEIPMTTATLGGEVRFESLDGSERLSIPKGTQPGALFRIRGKGAPRRRGRGRGDLLVRAGVVTPSDLSREEEKLVRKLAELRGEGTDGAGVVTKLRKALGLEE